MTPEDLVASGKRMYALAERMWSYPRSLTGDGVRKTLAEIANVVDDLVIHEVPSGTKVSDWVVPNEWNLHRAQLLGPDGRMICDTKVNNLHVLGYSIPFKGEVELDELDKHLYSLPELPDAIPYVTSYYEPRWGFCLSETVRKSLKAGKYFVDIDTTLQPGHLIYGDLLLKGSTDNEILISTYVCHPSMANNELSGPVVASELARHLAQQTNRRYSYRFVFAPETIGAIAYLDKNLEILKSKVRAGFVVTCVGDERAYSLLPTRDGNHAIDQIGRHVLTKLAPLFKEYPWTARGSDERQYSAPLVDLPVISMMRSKYWEYPEYHTSLDVLGSVVTAEGLAGGFDAIRRAISILERDSYPTTCVIAEPMLGRRGLYATIGGGRYSSTPQRVLDVWSYCDGSRSVLEIANTLGITFEETIDVIELLSSHEIVRLAPRFL
jgi:aminopeptidase-like protein